VHVDIRPIGIRVCGQGRLAVDILVEAPTRASAVSIASMLQAMLCGRSDDVVLVQTASGRTLRGRSPHPRERRMHVQRLVPADRAAAMPDGRHRVIALHEVPGRRIVTASSGFAARLVIGDDTIERLRSVGTWGPSAPSDIVIRTDTESHHFVATAITLVPSDSQRRPPDEVMAIAEARAIGEGIDIERYVTRISERRGDWVVDYEAAPPLDLRGWPSHFSVVVLEDGSTRLHKGR